MPASCKPTMVPGLTLVAIIAAGACWPLDADAQQRRNRDGRTAASGAQSTEEAPPSKPVALPKEITGESYIPVVVPDFETARKKDIADRPAILQRQKDLLESRYDLRDDPSDLAMSGGRKQVQQGVRVKLPEGVTWDSLAAMTPAEIKEKDAWPGGFRQLPHVKQNPGGMVIRKEQIKAIMEAEHRDLERFDAELDLPEHFLPEFPPPIYLTNRPDAGDVSQGQVVTIRNFHALFKGKLTPIQLEGLRLLLTPFPQQQFNATGDRKVDEASTGISCFDCHTNGHTNASIHLNPDTRPQALRFRLDTPSLRGMFNQQIHGSKRSLRSVEDFTEFEQRTAYFDGDQVTAAKKGIHAPDRATSIAPMAQFQNMLDFPPAPKLDLYGKLDPEKASEGELRGQELFFGKARCAECHPAPNYLDNQMHDLHLERFYEAKLVNDHFDYAAGPMKTMTLRGIKDSPPYLHDGRLLTLDDAVEFFNLVQGLKLNKQEKADLVAFLKTL